MVHTESQRILDLNPLPNSPVSGTGTAVPDAARFRQYCLFLDVDGTLVEFAATPAEVRIEPSLAALIGFNELAKAGLQMNTITFEPVAVFGTVSLIYFAMCFPLSMLARRLEKKLHVGTLRVQAL